MIELLDQDSYESRQAATRLADTLHNFGILDDDMFDLLLIDIYEKYGVDSYGDICDNDYL